MRRVAFTLAPIAFAALSVGCAPPKPTEPQSTAVYAEPPAAAPAPVTRTSVNEPEGETLGSPPAAPAPADPNAPASAPVPAAAAPAAAAPAAPAPAAAAPAARPPAPAK